MGDNELRGHTGVFCKVDPLIRLYWGKGNLKRKAQKGSWGTHPPIVLIETVGLEGATRYGVGGWLFFSFQRASLCW